jgi:hypothetical protein
MSENDAHGSSGTSKSGTGDVELIEVTVDAQPDLYVAPPRKANGSYAVKAHRIEFSATVKVAETAAEGTWKVGWIQTIYPCSHSVTYQSPSGPAQGKMTATVPAPVADGVSQEDTGHFAWSEHVPDEGEAGQQVTATADDEPSVPFRKEHDGKEADWMKGWAAVATSGSMSFGTWLVAESPGGAIEYLYHVDWHVDFGTTLADGEIVAATGKLAITKRGPGQGDLKPCLSPSVINDDPPRYQPIRI